MDATGKETEEMHGHSDDAGIIIRQRYSWSLFPVEKKDGMYPEMKNTFSLFFMTMC